MPFFPSPGRLRLHDRKKHIYMNLVVQSIERNPWPNIINSHIEVRKFSMIYVKSFTLYTYNVCINMYINILYTYIHMYVRVCILHDIKIVRKMLQVRLDSVLSHLWLCNSARDIANLHLHRYSSIVWLCTRHHCHRYWITASIDRGTQRSV